MTALITMRDDAQHAESVGDVDCSGCGEVDDATAMYAVTPPSGDPFYLCPRCWQKGARNDGLDDAGKLGS